MSEQSNETVQHKDGDQIFCNIDLSKYITEETIGIIARKMIEDKLSLRIDNMINGIISTYEVGLDQIVFERIIDRYIDKLTPKFESSLIKCINKVIDEDWDKGDDLYNSMHYTTINGLSDCIRKYIKDNHEKVCESLKNRIDETIRSIGDDRLRKMITDRININDILRQVFSEISNERNNDKR